MCQFISVASTQAQEEQKQERPYGECESTPRGQRLPACHVEAVLAEQQGLGPRPVCIYN
jgi:hypothetical protein